MSVGASAIGQMPVGADPAPPASIRKAPPKRSTTALADVVQQPEAR